MFLSVFDIFSIGVGPSSSHTVGPMRAARAFSLSLKDKGLLAQISEIYVLLYGSLALTGVGHGTDRAVVAGLAGNLPESVELDYFDSCVDELKKTSEFSLLGEQKVAFDYQKNLVFLRDELLPGHSNGMKFVAMDKDGKELQSGIYYSVGGGFVVDEQGNDPMKAAPKKGKAKPAPYPFRTGADLLEIGSKTGLLIHQIMWENEKALRSEKEIRDGLLDIFRVMEKCIERGLKTRGTLPGGLNVRRRAPRLYENLKEQLAQDGSAQVDAMDWLSTYAMAVNEENAAGGRVVTAPTNGAAGIVPAVLHYYFNFVDGADEQGVIDFLLAAAAIGILYKHGASLSAAEMGCQGEIGVACSMAAGAYTAVRGGTNIQIENAAEMGMEHNLGLTCDPVGGLVQVPCIERNTMGAVKAVNASRLAMRCDEETIISLDTVIQTMKQTGEDMQHHYKETSLGGLAIAVTKPEC